MTFVPFHQSSVQYCMQSIIGISGTDISVTLQRRLLRGTHFLCNNNVRHKREIFKTATKPEKLTIFREEKFIRLQIYQHKIKNSHKSHGRNNVKKSVNIYKGM